MPAAPVQPAPASASTTEDAHPIGAALLDDLLSPDLSLSDVAKRHATPLSELLLDLAAPDADTQLAVLHTLAADRVRLIAAHLLPTALGSLTHILEAFNRAPENQIPKPPIVYYEGVDPLKPEAAAPSTSNHPVAPAPDAPPTPDQLHRRRECARRAATTVVRLAHFKPIRYRAGPLYNPIASAAPLATSPAPAVTAHAPPAPSPARQPESNPTPTPRPPQTARDPAPPRLPGHIPSTPLPLHSSTPSPFHRAAHATPRRSPTALLATAGAATHPP